MSETMGSWSLRTGLSAGPRRRRSLPTARLPRCSTATRDRTSSRSPRNSNKGGTQTASHTAHRHGGKALLSLCAVLCGRLDPDVLEKLYEIACLCEERKYVQAHDL